AALDERRGRGVVARHLQVRPLVRTPRVAGADRELPPRLPPVVVDVDAAREELVVEAVLEEAPQLREVVAAPAERDLRAEVVADRPEDADIVDLALVARARGRDVVHTRAWRQ